MRSAWESPFVGRIDEVPLVLGAFAGGERLVTLLGPPGMGKSRLARRVLEAFAEEGVVCLAVDLTSSRSAEDLEAAVLAAAGAPSGLPEGGAHGGVVRALAAAGKLVLLLDAIENIGDAAAAVLLRWLAAAPELRLLATSRQRLRLAAAHPFELGPLSPQASVALFEARARRAKPGFELRAEERGTVEALALRLDGLPLAIELAAALTRLARPREQLAHFGPREVLESQGSVLREAIRSSFASLSAPARRALLATSVLSAPQPFELVLALATAVHPGTTWAALEEVLDASLARTIAEPGSEVVLLAPFAAVRHFARGELEPEALRAAERARSDLLLARLKAEARGVDELSDVALRVSLEQELRDATAFELEERPLVAARLALELHPLALSRGPLDLHRVRVEGVLRALSDDADAGLVGRLRHAAGLTCFLQGQIALACEHLALALARATEVGDQMVADDARTALMLAMQWREGRGGEPVDSALDEGGLSGFGLLVRGLAMLHGGEVEAAAEVLIRAREVSLGRGRAREAARSLALYGLVRHELGARDLAKRAFDEAEGELVRVGDEHFLAILSLWRALWILDRGEAADAAARLEITAHTFDRIGDPFFEAAARGYRGFALLVEGQSELAYESLERALPFLRAAGDHYRLGVYLPLFALAHAERGDPGAATAALADAEAVASRATNPNLRLLHAVLASAVGLVLARHAEPATLHVATLAADRAAAEARVGELARFAVSTDVRFAVRVLDRVRRAVDRASGREARGAPNGSALQVSHDGGWFRVDGHLVQLRRRVPLKRILGRLIAERLAGAGEPVATTDLVAAGWPGERLVPASASNRVHVAVGTLRRLGLERYITRVRGGYLLPPEIPLEVAEGEGPGEEEEPLSLRRGSPPRP